MAVQALALLTRVAHPPPERAAAKAPGKAARQAARKHEQSRHKRSRFSPSTTLEAALAAPPTASRESNKGTEPERSGHKRKSVTPRGVGSRCWAAPCALQPCPGGARQPRNCPSGPMR